MSLEEKINNGIKVAILAKEKDKLNALRAIKSAILLAKTEKGGIKMLDEVKEIKLLQKLVKQRRESADIYKSQGRDDLYEKEIAEMKVIQEYLPQQMSKEEIENIVRQIIDQLGVSSVKEIGKVMGVATKKLAGKAEGKQIAEIVQAILS
jgi:uncharacterized protein YqeY